METITVYAPGTIGSCQATLVIGHTEAGLERCRSTITHNLDDLITSCTSPIDASVLAGLIRAICPAFPKGTPPRQTVHSASRVPCCL